MDSFPRPPFRLICCCRFFFGDHLIGHLDDRKVVLRKEVSNIILISVCVKPSQSMKHGRRRRQSIFVHRFIDGYLKRVFTSHGKNQTLITVVFIWEMEVEEKVDSLISPRSLYTFSWTKRAHTTSLPNLPSIYGVYGHFSS